jgi:hypothetical protein
MRFISIPIAVLLGVTAYSEEARQSPPSADAHVVPAPAPAPASRIAGTVFVESDETVDSSNSKDKAKHTDFGAAIRAALIKKEVPVKVVTDAAKAQFTIKSTSSHREDSTGTKIAKMAFFGGGSFSHFDGSIEVIDNESSAVVFAYNVKKSNYQSAAEAFAKHYKNDYLEKNKH